MPHLGKDMGITRAHFQKKRLCSPSRICQTVGLREDLRKPPTTPPELKPYWKSR